VFFKPKGQADQNAITKANQDLTLCFERLEKELGNNEYLAGSFSLADISFASWAPLFGPLQIEVPANCPRVKAWLARLAERTSVKVAG
jgi:glutathione S-transferase